MKNTRREGPGRCAFMMQCHQFFGGRPQKKENVQSSPFGQTASFGE